MNQNKGSDAGVIANFNEHIFIFDEDDSKVEEKRKNLPGISSIFMGISSIHLILFFGVLLLGSSAIFLALPREDVMELGIARVGLELFLLVLTFLGAVVLYRPYRDISHTLVLTFNVILITTTYVIQSELNVSLPLAGATLTGLSLMIGIPVFYMEAAIYRSKVIGMMGILCFLLFPSFLVGSAGIFSLFILTGAVLIMGLRAGMKYNPVMEEFIPINILLQVLSLAIPVALALEVFRELSFVWMDENISLLMIAAWPFAGIYYLVMSAVDKSQSDAYAGTILLAISGVVFELVLGRTPGSLLWITGAIYALVGALDYFYQDMGKDILKVYGKATRYMGLLLVIMAIARSIAPWNGNQTIALTFDGQSALETISRFLTVGLGYLPALEIVIGTVLVYGIGSWLSRRNLEVTTFLAGLSLAYLSAANALIDALNAYMDVTPTALTPGAQIYMGAFLAPLVIGLVGAAMYGEWKRIPDFPVTPLYGFGLLWAGISSILTIIEMSNNISGAIIFAVYAAFAGVIACYWQRQWLIRVFSIFATLFFIAAMMPAGIANEHIAFIIAGIAFLFYIIGLLLYLSEETQPIGFIVQNTGMSMTGLTALFALSVVKFSPESLTLALCLGAIIVAIEYMRSDKSYIAYLAITLSLVLLLATFFFIPTMISKVWFYTTTLGAYSMVGCMMFRQNEQEELAWWSAMGGIAIVIAPTFYYMFLFNGNNPAYLGLLVIQIGVLFFAGFFLRSRVYLYIPLAALICALGIQLFLGLWVAGSGGLVSVILIMIVIGVPATTFAITLAVARDSFIRAGQQIHERLEEWGF